MRITWTPENEAALREYYPEHSQAEFDHLTRAWSDHRKKSELESHREEEEDSVTQERNTGVISAWRSDYAGSFVSFLSHAKQPSVS